jgi:hypothetical protein
MSTIDLRGICVGPCTSCCVARGVVSSGQYIPAPANYLALWGDTPPTGQPQDEHGKYHPIWVADFDAIPVPDWPTPEPIYSAYYPPSGGSNPVWVNAPHWTVASNPDVIWNRFTSLTSMDWRTNPVMTDNFVWNMYAGTYTPPKYRIDVLKPVTSDAGWLSYDNGLLLISIKSVMQAFQLSGNGYNTDIKNGICVAHNAITKYRVNIGFSNWGGIKFGSKFVFSGSCKLTTYRWIDNVIPVFNQFDAEVVSSHTIFGNGARFTTRVLDGEIFNGYEELMASDEVWHTVDIPERGCFVMAEFHNGFLEI